MTSPTSQSPTAVTDRLSGFTPQEECGRGKLVVGRVNSGQERGEVPQSPLL
jgi:hypothetical protein